MSKGRARLDRRAFVSSLAASSVLVGTGCQIQRRREEDIREVGTVVTAVASRDGAGVKLRRALGNRQLPMVDPFLLLDEIHSSNPDDWKRGFPTHPHRGFETVSYLISGAFVHRDSVGNHGRIADGGVQWMTAGRGIIHSEMPDQRAGGDLWGLQLWVNLPASHKMSKPRYQELVASDIPTVELDDARVRLVAGAVGQVSGPVEEIVVKPTFFDAALEAGARFRHLLPLAHSAFVYMLDGAAVVGRNRVALTAGQAATLEPGRREVQVQSDGGARFLLFAAAAIGEPVARRGPFVMNTDAEIRQAFDDYRSGRLVQ